MFIDFRERGREEERGRETLMLEGNIYRLLLPRPPTRPNLQSRHAALAGHWTCDLLFMEWCSKQLSHMGQGRFKNNSHKRTWKSFPLRLVPWILKPQVKSIFLRYVRWQEAVGNNSQPLHRAFYNWQCLQRRFLEMKWTL